MVARLRRFRWFLLLLGASLGAVVASAGPHTGAGVALADVGIAGNRGESALGGPMDGQPVQSLPPNTTYPPEVRAGSGKAIAASSPAGWLLAGVGLLTLTMMAGAVGLVVRHRRRHPGMAR